jgi:hypothetical protein
MKVLAVVALLATAAAITPAQEKTGHYLSSSKHQVTLKDGVVIGPEVMPLAGSTRAIILLMVAFFFCHSGIYFMKMYLDFVGGASTSPILEILERGTKNVSIAPMLSVLFLATRLRAVYLKKVDNELQFMNMRDIPSDLAQTSMLVASSCVVAQVGFTVLVPFVSGEFVFGASKLSGVDENRKGIAGIIATIRVLVTLAMIVFTAIVVAETINMKSPTGKDVAVSPAVQCTMMLTCAYFIAYVMADGCRTLHSFLNGEDANESIFTKLDMIFRVALDTMAMAPMCALLFICVRMRAIAMGHNNPQKWAQDAMFATTCAIVTTAAITVVGPLTFSGPPKAGIVEGDITYEVENTILALVFTIIRYVCLFSIYVGLTIVVASTFMIEAPGGKPTPPMATAIQTTLMLTDIYFLSMLGVWIGATLKQFMGEQGWINTMILMFDSAKATTTFIPMACMLFVAARLRSIQVAGPHKAPQNWAQIFMWLSASGITVAAVMAFVQPVLGGDEGTGTCGMINNVLRSLCSFALHLGCVAVVVSLFLITPENAGDLGLQDPAAWAGETTGLAF